MGLEVTSSYFLGGGGAPWRPRAPDLLTQPTGLGPTVPHSRFIGTNHLDNCLCECMAAQHETKDPRARTIAKCTHKHPQDASACKHMATLETNYNQYS